jgi:D-lyxose ketol-isomerase
MKRSEIINAQRRAAEIYRKANIIITDAEAANIEIADFGLNDLENTGLELITYVNTDRVCAKELAMFPHQTCPQHRHPMVDGRPGKEETFRCRWGKVYIYVTGEPTENCGAKPPRGAYDVFHEIVLEPGMQYTLEPDTWHWFQAGDEGAVVSEFSTHSTDENDVFLDQDIVRVPEIEED